MFEDEDARTLKIIKELEQKIVDAENVKNKLEVLNGVLEGYLGVFEGF